MKFAVIYEFDCTPDTPVGHWQPPQVRKLWTMTEGDSEYNCNHMGEFWEGGKHRKYCAVLTREQFEEFVDRMGFRASDIGCGGMLGFPTFGMSPGIVFDGDGDEACLVSATVCPYPEVVNCPKDKEFTERDWDRVRNTVIREFS